MSGAGVRVVTAPLPTLGSSYAHTDAPCRNHKQPHQRPTCAIQLVCMEGLASLPQPLFLSQVNLAPGVIIQQEYHSSPYVPPHPTLPLAALPDVLMPTVRAQLLSALGPEVFHPANKLTPNRTH